MEIRAKKSPLGVVFLGLFAVLAAIVLVSSRQGPTQERVHAYQKLMKKSVDFHEEYARAAVASNHSRAASFAAAAADEDYTCDAGRPCSNGACCGKSGNCGYGPDYCGDGCLSNCDAHAECGKFAKDPGEKCPLNVCCSQYGFCGTTKLFCDDKCQSNCEEHPKPPGGGGGDVRKRVIGYYEGWNYNSKCHQTKPEDLPLSVLTHINFAFAFLSPNSYNIIPMTDGKTPHSLFAKTTALKSIKPDLKVFISLGGWTFSDNGTVTQPLLGEIAADAGKRTKFAKNIVSFLQENAFDGIDIDWEYPGAPDRGGKKEDTANMVKMFAEIRKAFDNSGKKYELTFTIPASYWYLRWFDVPKLLKYADWTNLMSYDIHGLWDRDNAIGNIVQPHTNLTEIQLAAELLWRVNVPPSKVSLGVGFYGRSFTLQDPSCSKPGCKFSGASRPGKCTNTGGYLAYYEIQDILKKNADIKVQHDNHAAVKYFSWDKDQWISFDDKLTFEQKVRWANDVGMSGLLVWASDLDDYEFTAHAGLMGKPVLPNNQLPIVERVVEHDTTWGDLTLPEWDKNCYRMPDCVDMDIVRCDSGYTKVGYDRSDCGSKHGKSICCKSKTAPTKCKWRGSGGDCNGQCHGGEVDLFHSSRGGGPEHESDPKHKCSRGSKAFCCEDTSYTALTQNCRWTKCGKNDCEDDEMKVAHAEGNPGGCHLWELGSSYCCKGKVAPVTNCHWVGKGDCADNTCASNDITIRRSAYGDSSSACNWGRKKILCCTPNAKALEPATCDSSLCKVDRSAFSCDPDRYADDFSDEYQCDPADCHDDEGKKSRAVSLDLVPLDERGLEKRMGAKRKFEVEVTIVGILHILHIWSRRYPGSTHLFDATNGPSAHNMAFRPKTGSCDTTEVEQISPSTMTRQQIEDTMDTEHNPDLQYVQALLETVATGRLPDGTRTNTAAIPPSTLQGALDQLQRPGTFPRTGRSVGVRTAADYLMDQFGSQGNRAPLVLAERNMNQMKGRVFSPNTDPQSESNFQANLRNSLNTGQGEDFLLEPIRMVISVFRYINHPDALPIVQHNRQALLDATQNISNSILSLSTLHALHQEFDYAWYSFHTDEAVDWVLARIEEIRAAYLGYIQTHNASPTNWNRVEAALHQLYKDVSEIDPPPKDTSKTKKP